jgi:DNA-binding transcriptional MerR regulator
MTLSKNVKIISKEKSVAAYRTIGEVSESLDVPQHILRFWEGKFSEINPQKNKGRRYYSPKDISVLKKIKYLLYEQGLTIKGVKQYLENKSFNIPEESQQLNLINSKEVEFNSSADKLKIILKQLNSSKKKLLSIF